MKKFLFLPLVLMPVIMTGVNYIPSILPGKSKLPSATLLTYGDQELQVPLSVGLWGIPLPVDYDGDGVNDLLVSCPDTPYRGIYYFRNKASNARPLFDKARPGIG